MKLIIKNADGTDYWTEHFSSIDDLNKWLEEEKTRSYWDNSRTHEIEEEVVVPPVEQEAWLIGRLAEYPSMQDVMEALIEDAEGRPEKLEEISAARAVVKANFPKPE